jgi:hypothetical protein
MKQVLALLLCFITSQSFSQDSLYIRIHFAYGSKPKKAFKETEPKWFGGIMGGHVGIEAKADSILNFLPKDKFHWFSKNVDKHSAYAIHTENGFYNILGNTSDSVKGAIIRIPITQLQIERFDSITVAYLKQTPYDYAFLGMRCGSASYEILSQLKIVPSYPNRKTFRKIFYPKKLRSILLKKAIVNGWKIEYYEGSFKRKWEKD